MNELYGIETFDLSDREIDKKGYAQYEWTYSLQARLNTNEKEMINFSPSRAERMKLPPTYQRCSSQDYQVMHAFR